VADLIGLQDVFAISLSTGQILRNLLLALLCGLLIAVFYVAVTGRYNQSRQFLNALVVLAMITAIVIMVIGNNLARAFGLVGAMSIIRFRTAVKDVQDIVFIFFSLAIGMAAGVGLGRVAFLGTVLVGLVAVGLSRVPSHSGGRREYVLQMTCRRSGATEPPYVAVLARFFSRYHLVNARSYEADRPTEIAYYVRLARGRSIDEAVNALQQIEGVETVSILFDENA
jgi:uncharacterized membrane protein YhiD involved in acid resistance